MDKSILDLIVKPEVLIQNEVTLKEALIEIKLKFSSGSISNDGNTISITLEKQYPNYVRDKIIELYTTEGWHSARFYSGGRYNEVNYVFEVTK